jgi:hypothetical protein
MRSQGCQRRASFMVVGSLAVAHDGVICPSKSIEPHGSGVVSGHWGPASHAGAFARATRSNPREDLRRRSRHHRTTWPLSTITQDGRKASTPSRHSRVAW